jgi:hypothetical protein
VEGDVMHAAGIWAGEHRCENLLENVEHIDF